jgi:hypothetical protein
MGDKPDVPMNKRKELEAHFHKRGYTDFKWIEPEKIVVSQ